jgi:hypothetical protein
MIRNLFSVRTMTKLMPIKHRYSSKKLEYKGFRDSQRNRVNRGAQIPTLTVRRLSQQLRGK